MMRAALFVFVAALGIGGCAYPTTQMEPVTEPAVGTGDAAGGGGAEKAKEKKEKVDATSASQASGAPG